MGSEIPSETRSSELAGEGSTETVPLPGPGNWRVRKWWTGSQEYQRVSDGATCELIMQVEVVDGVPLVREVHLRQNGDWLLDATALDNLHLGRAFNGLVRDEAIFSTKERWLTPDELLSLPGPEFLRYMGQRDDDAYRASKGTRRRRAVTPEVLADVLRLYDEGGIQKVIAGTHFSESYAFKLLRKARKEQS